MSGTRVPFDPDLPIVVATQDGLAIGGKVYAHGGALPWRELGISQSDLVQLWAYYKIDCVAPAESKIAVHSITPGESIDVRTPQQTISAKKRQRAAQRASE